MILYLLMLNQLIDLQQRVEVPQQHLIQQQRLILPQHIQQQLRTKLVEQQHLKLVEQRHLILVKPLVKIHLKTQQRHLIHKHHITHTLTLKLVVVVDALERVYKKSNIYVNITIWQIHYEEQII